jgi:hypothetical protein
VMYFAALGEEAVDRLAGEIQPAHRGSLRHQPRRRGRRAWNRLADLPRAWHGRTRTRVSRLPAGFLRG